MNTVKLEIQNEKGVWITWDNTVIPVKYGKLLDEQLDYATVTLQRVKKEVFKPLTRARLTVKSNTEYGNEQTETLDYFIANDDFFESPIGKTPKQYTHNLTLIELTKYLECFPLETLCFTNPGAKEYKQIDLGIVVKELEHQGFINYVPAIQVNGALYEQGILNPIGAGVLKFPSVYQYLQHTNFGDYSVDWNDVYRRIKNEVKIISLSGEETTYGFDINATNTLAGTIPQEDREKVYTQIEVPINNGSYRVNINMEFIASPPDITYRIVTEKNGDLTVIPLLKPLKPWTVEEVILRTLQLVEPLKQDEKTRFSFEISKETYPEIFEQFAPEFTFTRMNLREAMQTVGGFIHAEPRLVIDKDENQKEFCRITFDFYGENKYATYKNYKTNTEGLLLSDYKYTTASGNYGIEQACTRLDSYMDNLVNRLDWEAATVGQPIGETVGAQTLRTETSTVESESDGYYFPSAYAIDKIVKMEYIHTDGNAYDITPYLFEITVYNTLSSFDETYPTSKSYALNFTYGQKGIKGFFYKVPNVTSGVGNNYSIINVINAAMGTNKSVSDFGGSSFYNKMKFRLTYIPIYSTRIQHGKQYLDDYLPLPRVMNYSQSDNSVETRFYGEHIKGAAQRMGNIDKNVTFIMRNVSNIPNAGELWDKDYYISSVSVSVKQDHFEITCGLSKNFNRKSKYIGASTYKRIYEVSEVMVQERHTVYTDYLVLSEYKEQNSSFFEDNEAATLLTTTAINAIVSMLTAYGYGINDYSLSTAYAYGESLAGSRLTEVFLPVVASAFGNVMEFTWEYKDNYSAGVKILPQTPNDETTYFGQDVQYSDYYGRMYYYTFRLLSNKETQQSVLGQSVFEQSANNYPQVSTNNNGMNAPSVSSGKFVDRKDSREAERKTYQIEIVADDPSFVIGSAFAAKNPLVYYDSNYTPPHLYVLPKKLNKFTSLLDFNGVEDLETAYIPNTARLFSQGKTSSVSGLSWCYAFPLSTKTVTVSNEDGTTKEIKINTGGEIVFGRNIDIAVNDTVGGFSITAVHDIFKYIQAKNNQ